MSPGEILPESAPRDSSRYSTDGVAPEHGLVDYGAAHRLDGSRTGFGVGGEGSAKCLCGALSGSLPSGAARRRWYAVHLAEARSLSVTAGEPSGPRVDARRYGRVRPTGIPIRAYDSNHGRWVFADIAELDRRSLTSWLRSRGGDNPWAESVVLTLLGHRPTGDDTDEGSTE